MAARPLFDPASIFCMPNNSAYGRFIAAIDGFDEESIPRGTFTLPRVVVIGSESAGKSSLLENITKCAVFPRAGGICTRMPVRLKLSSSTHGDDECVRIVYHDVETRFASTDGILEFVTARMNDLGDGISMDELTISIRAPDMPTFEFIDLPGMRTYPPQLATAADALVTRYLSEPHTLVLCVAQASDRLTANQAIAKVLELGKQSSTVLALTKADLIDDAVLWKALILDRVLGRSEELTGLNLHGCVAVVNRFQDGAVGADRFRLLPDVLRQAGEWFQRKLQAYTVNDPQIEALAAGSLTVAKLITKVDEMFLAHIRRVWRPVALEQLATLRRQTVAAVNALGPAPAFTSPASVVQEIAQYADAKWVPAFSSIVSSVSGPWGSRTWSASQRHDRAAFEVWFENFTHHDKSFYWLEIERVLSAAFNRDTPLRTARFATAKVLIVASARGVYQRELARVLPRLRNVVTVELDRLLGSESGRSVCDVATLAAGILLVECVTPAIGAVSTTELNRDELAEAPADAATRDAMEARLALLRNAIEIIKHF